MPMVLGMGRGGGKYLLTLPAMAHTIPTSTPPLCERSCCDLSWVRLGHVPREVCRTAFFPTTRLRYTNVTLQESLSLATGRMWRSL